MTYPFDPDWVLAPADLLRTWLEDRRMGTDELAAACVPYASLDGARKAISDVLTREPLKEHHARVLMAGTGVTAQTWLNAERLYREGLAAGKEDVT